MIELTKNDRKLHQSWNYKGIYLIILLSAQIKTLRKCTLVTKNIHPHLCFTPFTLFGNERVKEWRIQIIFEY